jgi:predicted molibdopterin-dependent oxidoreductase YjgC
MLAPGQIDTCEPELLRATRKAADQLHVPIQIHAGQSPNEFERIKERHGMTTVEYLEAAWRGELDGLYCIGGNFLETLPEPKRVADALAKIPLRIHTDLVLTSQMLVEPADTVFVLPARTRYEQRGGGTETSTERRVIFSPELPRDGIGEARSEWEMLLDFAKAVRPEAAAQLDFADGAAIRADIERAVPSYRGIAALAKEGDQFQWGGPALCTERRFATSDGKAHFQAVAPMRRSAATAAVAPGGAERNGRTFRLATRRGKQFNSMVQQNVDGLTGAARDHIFMSAPDAARLRVRRDDPILLKGAVGTFRGRVFIADVAVGTLQGHWPEVNGLLPANVLEPKSLVPDYNADVEVEPLPR